MPQVVLFALIGALGVVAMRMLARQRQQAEIRVRQTQRTGAQRPIANLVQDPVTGIYHPARHD